MMMLPIWSNTLLSVRQATLRNAGRGTAGVDGQVALTSRARMDLAVLVHGRHSEIFPAAAGPPRTHNR
jgi:RNA-directed DNA polymerase